MGAVHLPVGAHELPGRELLASPAADKGSVVPVGHKADVLAVPLAGIDKAVLLGQGPGLVFGQPPQGQQQPGKLPLGQGVEHIALVLVLIQALFQQPAARGFIPFHPGVVACGHIGVADLLPPAHELLKLDIPVAVHAGVGGFPMLVGGGKPVHHFPAEASLKLNT